MQHYRRLFKSTRPALCGMTDAFVYPCLDRSTLKSAEKQISRYLNIENSGGGPCGGANPNPNKSLPFGAGIQLRDEKSLNSVL
jgi:hypothetical protein